MLIYFLLPCLLPPLFVDIAAMLFLRAMPPPLYAVRYHTLRYYAIH